MSTVGALRGRQGRIIERGRGLALVEQLLVEITTAAYEDPDGAASPELDAGESDETLDDIYPSELRGLIHVIGFGGPDSPETSIYGGTTFLGSIVADSALWLQNATIRFDPRLVSNPPEGYYQLGLILTPTAWRQEVNP